MLLFTGPSKNWIIHPCIKNKCVRKYKVSCVTKTTMVYVPMPLQRKENSLGIISSVENVISELQQSQEDNFFFLFCNINRSHLNYSLFYRLTSLKLRAEADEKIRNQAQIISGFRRKIQENILILDQPVTQGLILAERRIKEIVNGDSFNEEDILKNIGESSIEISCFWIVLNAALTAWEAKNYFESSETNSHIYSKMRTIQQVLSESKKHQILLPIEIKFLDSKLNVKENKIDEDETEISFIEGVKLLINQLEKLPVSSYSYFLEKVNKIFKELFLKNCGKKIQTFQDSRINFNPVKIESLSRLVLKKSI